MDETEQMLDDCERRESHLSDWERGFIDDMGRRVAAGKRLTPNQSEKLEQIWERVTDAYPAG